MSLIQFHVSNFRGIVEMKAAPNGKSVTFKGKNGAGKSSAVDAIFWALGGNLDGEVVRNESEGARTEVVFDDYLVTRTQKKGKKATLTVKSADGKATFSSPAALLAGFLGAIERKTFSSKSGKEQREVLLKLAPQLDCSDLDRKRQEAYEARTAANRDARDYKAQAEGVAVPAVVEVGEERTVEDVVDVSVIVEKKAGAAEQKAANDRQRADARNLSVLAQRLSDDERLACEKVDRARRELEAAMEASEEAAKQAVAAQDKAVQAQLAAAALKDPDTTEIDREIAAAREKNKAARAEAEAHNRAVRAAQQQEAERRRLVAEKQRLADKAQQAQAKAAELTATIESVDAEKVKRLAEAPLPIQGLSLSGDAVLFDDGKHGPVEARQGVLNDATCIRLDVAIAKALGYRLVAVRNGERLDATNRAAVDRFAAENGIQLLTEVRTDDAEVVEAVIEEGVVPEPTAKEPAAEPEQSEFDL